MGDIDAFLDVAPGRGIACRSPRRRRSAAPRALPGDVAVIDRSRAPANGAVVLALVDGEFTIRTYRVGSGVVVLEAGNPDFPDIAVGENTAFEVWGVVTGIVRSF